VLVAEIEFSEWTDDGRLRHPRFKGLRDDKPAAEVVVERPSAAGSTDGEAVSDDAVSGEAAGGEAGGGVADAGSSRRRVQRRTRLTHPDKVLFPDDGITKRDLADYWRAVADHALPMLRDRPLMLLRCPDGHGANCFYQKHVGISMPDSVPRVVVDSDEEPYCMVDSPSAIQGLVQLAVLELHPFGSRADRLDQPDVLVFDLDPDEGLEWSLVVAAAFELRSRLADLGLAGFVRLTGGKGLHVVVPVAPGPGWPAVKKFARALADEMVRAAPGRFTSTAAKRRRQGRIFIDYLRNDRGATAIASYSPRARSGAPVALPVAWDSLDRRASEPPRFGLREVPELLARRSDPWAGFEAARRPLV
jgi:bifunctional non-homologous end joining protein LigD